MDSNWNISDDLFPNDISVYHASGSFKDLCISLSGDSPPLFYVSTHSSWSSKPSVVLHGGPIPSVSPLASAHFHSFSSAVDIALGNENHNLIKRGIFSTSLTFEVFISSTSQNEYFTWKSSWGAEVASIQGRNYGLKLVRASTGEVVAAWAKPKSSIRKKGKLRFLVRDFYIQ